MGGGRYLDDDTRWVSVICFYPLLFETKAERLKELFFMRVVTPPDAEDETWLEARPRFKEDAHSFARVELILNTKDMMPFAMQIHVPNGKNRTAYAFEDMKRNEYAMEEKGTFAPEPPEGWKLVVEQTPAAAGGQ